MVHIPARAGSSRVPDKNARLLGGHPLLAYTIRMALLLPDVDIVAVNTESPRYAALAREHGAEVPALRPPELASDQADLGQALRFLLDHLAAEGRPVGTFINMFPTSPFRNLSVLRDLRRRLDHFRGVATVVRLAPGLSGLYHGLGASLAPLDDLVRAAPPQATWVKVVAAFEGYHVGPEQTRPGPPGAVYYHPLTHPAEMIDIDREEDFELAERVVREGLYDFGVDPWSA